VRAILSGPGNMSLAGSTVTLDADIWGSGDLEAKDLTLARARTSSHGPGGVVLGRVSDMLAAQVDGSGNVTATISGKRAQLTLNGPGDSHLDGDVGRLDARMSGSGQLDASGLVAGTAEIKVLGSGEALVNLKGRSGARIVRFARDGVREAGGAESAASN
jgi:hypothetical protein